MKIWMRVLKALGFLWLILAGILITVGTIGVWMKGGFAGVLELLSPFNIWNWLLTIIIVAPGIAALIWAVVLEGKMKTTHTSH